jgi:hypothetical protein
MKVTTVEEAVDFFLQTMERYPERDATTAFNMAFKGEVRKDPVIRLSYADPEPFSDKSSYAIELPEIAIEDLVEANLCKGLLGRLKELEILNPVSSNLLVSERSPEELITCFGIPLNPETAYSPAYTKSIDQVLAEGMPDPATTGSLPQFKREIDIFKSKTPESMKISRFNAQAPFTLLHSLVGEELFMAPYLYPDKFHEIMSQFTDFWIEAVQLTIDWIGPERQAGNDAFIRLAECTCNLISRDMYEEFVLPYDLRVAETFKRPLHIHPCSGPHVFHETLELLPGVASTEAGYIDPKTATAGAISVDEALETIDTAPIFLEIGQEIPEKGKEFEFITRDLDRYANNKRLMFGYSGMYWRHGDRDEIRDLHQRLDEYWYERYQ